MTSGDVALLAARLRDAGCPDITTAWETAAQLLELDTAIEAAR